METIKSIFIDAASIILLLLMIPGFISVCLTIIEMTR